MNKKGRLTIMVLVLTVVLAGGAVYIGSYLNQQQTSPNNVSAAATCPSGDFNITVGGVLYCYKSSYPSGSGCSVSASSSSVCLTVTRTSGDYFYKHWCSADVKTTSYPNGCNCPGGSYCLSGSHSRTSGTDCVGSSCNPEVAQNNTATMCLSLNTSDCDFQQVDYQHSSTTCYLSGGIYDSSTCHAQPSNTPINTPTNIPTDTPTPIPTQTFTPTPTPTGTLLPSNTPTSTSMPTSTPTRTPTPTLTPTGTLLPSHTPTPTLTPSTTPTGTLLPSNTPTITPTGTQTITPSLPHTALTPDQGDQIIAGVTLILIGLMVYSFGFNEKLGKFFWNIGGRNVLPHVSKKFDKQEVKDIREGFEKRIKRKTRD